MKNILFFLFLLVTKPFYAQGFDYTTTIATYPTNPEVFVNEPSIASFENYVALGTNYNTQDGAVNKVGFFYSTDYGDNWNESPFPKGFNGNSIDDSDPALAFDDLGNLYFL